MTDLAPFVVGVAAAALGSYVFVGSLIARVVSDTMMRCLHCRSYRLQRLEVYDHRTFDEVRDAFATAGAEMPMVTLNRFARSGRQFRSDLDAHLLGCKRCGATWMQLTITVGEFTKRRLPPIAITRAQFDAFVTDGTRRFSFIGAEAATARIPRPAALTRS